MTMKNIYIRCYVIFWYNGDACEMIETKRNEKGGTRNNCRR